VAMAYQEFVYSYLLEKGKEITRRWEIHELPVDSEGTKINL
jgi:hypothetical protein